MSRGLKGKSLPYIDSDPDYELSKAKKQRTNKPNKPNMDYAIIENPQNDDEHFDNIYRTSTIVGGKYPHLMNTNKEIALENTKINDAGLPKFCIPYEQPKFKLPYNPVVALREKYKINPNVKITQTKFEDPKKSNELPLNCTVLQNDAINLSAGKSANENLSVNALNLTKTKDAETITDDNIIVNDEEKNFIASLRASNITISSLSSLLANKDSDVNNNSKIQRNYEDTSETIDLLDDDYDGGTPNIDPNVLKILEDQSEANKSFIGLLLKILTKGHIIVANEVESMPTEIILEKLNLAGVDVLKLIELLKVCLQEYLESKNKTRQQPLVANKSTETVPNIEIRTILNPPTFQLTTSVNDGGYSSSVSTQTNEPALQVQLKSVSQPHCPSQDVHSIICRPNQQYNYSQQTNQNTNTVQQPSQIVAPRQTPFAMPHIQAVMPQKNFASAITNFPAIPAQNIQINSSQPLPQNQNNFQLPQNQTESVNRPYYNTQGSMDYSYQNSQQKQGSGRRSSQEVYNSNNNNSSLRYGGHGRPRQSFNPCNNAMPHIGNYSDRYNQYNNVTAVTESSYSHMIRHQNSVDPRFNSSQNAMGFYNQMDNYACNNTSNVQ
ncbi:GATA zinc finger domain-containing protein 14-like [Bombyx mori]|uniref:GATA zinc finger domain-containing protein 14-like n=2 Tax=Bombyx mori TaxID=7091 RepID=UPI002ED63045